jgi:hypothetical protein
MTHNPAFLLSISARTDAARKKSPDEFVKGLLFYADMAGRHRIASVILIITLTIGLRCALLLWLPRPHPWVHDEFAYLLGADTFASGRLTNPAHPLWPFFEATHIIVHPTYTMKYQPGQSAFLALGQVLFGDPYWGVVISVGLMAGAICWMMQSLLLPGWALIGGLFTAAAFGGGHYWIQSYWGGAVPALASALMIGSVTHIVRHGRNGFIWLFTVGSILGLLTRPYETGVLTAILVIALIGIHIRGRSWTALWKLALPYASGLIIWASFQMYYDWRITGHPLKFPYMLHEEQYAVAPSFWILPPRKAPRPRSPALYANHWIFEKDQYDTLKNMSWGYRARFLLNRAITADDWEPGFHTTFPGLVGLLRYLLVLAPVFWFSRRVQYLAILAAALGLSTCLTVGGLLHYLAPFIVAALALIFLLISYARSLDARGRRVGNLLVAMILLYLPLEPLLIARNAMNAFRDGAFKPFVRERMRITATLEHASGRHVVIVRYRPDDHPRPDWVYNSANIDAQQIIWAGDRGSVENRKLLAYYHDRHIWLLYPDESPARLEPYRE